MRYYELTNKPTQQFTIDINKKKFDIALRWMPAAGIWIVDVKTEDKAIDVRGVALQLYVKIFKQYGVPEIIFYAEVEEVTRDLAEVKLCVLNQQEEKKHTVLIPPRRGYEID